MRRFKVGRNWHTYFVKGMAAVTRPALELIINVFCWLFSGNGNPDSDVPFLSVWEKFIGYSVSELSYLYFKNKIKDAQTQVFV